MDQLINPAALYGLLVLGAIGTCLALPRRTLSPQLLGAIIAAAAGGLLMLVIGVNARSHLPNFYFYVFSAIALGASLRVITHPRPVYAALYFVLTVLASAGLFVVLGAEFVAFALIIVYAGAILITYLFVIMLATQAPNEDQLESTADYDRQSNEPVAATAVGFVLLGVLTTMLFGGLNALPPPHAAGGDTLARLPGKVEGALRRAHLIEADEHVTMSFKGTGPDGRALVDLPQGIIAVSKPGGESRYIARETWPAGLAEELTPTNTERVGFNLLADHPGSIEIAGVILLMAMLGAVVLARKQVELDEAAKARHQASLAEGVP